MALSNYSELQASVASWLHRSDLTTQIKDFIALAEADLQVRAKLTQWDAEATLAISSGSASLPGDFAHAISLRYGTQTSILPYITPERLKHYDAQLSAGEPGYYTIIGDTLRITPTTDGSVYLLYTARFTPLSDSATTNSLLTLFPDAYLQGSIAQAMVWLQDDVGAQRHGNLFEVAVQRIKKYMLDRKYPDGLEMKVI